MPRIEAADAPTAVTADQAGGGAERAVAAWHAAESRLRAMRPDHPARQALEVAVAELAAAAHREVERARTR